MALVNLLQEVARRVDAGEAPRHAARDPRFDFTPTMQSAVDRGDSLYLPRRTVDGEDVPYRVEGLVPRRPASRGRGFVGATIVSESAAVTVTAGDPRAWIMRLDGDSAEGLSITGGTWGPRSRGVLRQTKVRGRPGSLNRACFERMAVRGCARGFEVGSANGVVWRDCVFFDVDDAGVYLGKSGDVRIRRGNVHSCSVERCVFERVGLSGRASAAIALDTENDRRGRSKQCLRVLACTFRQVGDHAVHARGWLYGFALEGCVFEEAASGGVCDVMLEGARVAIRSAAIRGNVFSTPCPRQRARVSLSGDVSCRIADNVCVVRDSMRFVDADAVPERAFRSMARNTVIDTGSTGPASRLAAPPATRSSVR